MAKRLQHRLATFHFRCKMAKFVQDVQIIAEKVEKLVNHVYCENGKNTVLYKCT